MHSRQQIREAFVSALSVIAGATIQNGRVFPVFEEILPFINVTTPEESIEAENNSGRIFGQQTRTLLVNVITHTKSTATLYDDLDAISESIEKAVYSDPTLLSIIRCLDLINVEVEVSGEGEKQIGILTNVFSCRYLTEDGKPEEILI